MIVLTLLSDLIGRQSAVGSVLFVLGGIFAWIAGARLVPVVRVAQKIMIALLLLFGLVLISYSYVQGGAIPWLRLLTINIGLLTMITSVGFLKLIAERGFTHDGKLPQGKIPFRDTILTVALFGSFINISAPILVADRLSQNRPLSLFAAATLTRTFAGCSCWSPFFGSMAVMLTYIEGMQLLPVMIYAFPFAVIGAIFVYFSAVFFRQSDVEGFHGYPLKPASLWIPAALACIVVALFMWLPALSILTIIALGSLFLAISTLLIQDSLSEGINQLGSYVNNRLTDSANELVLFLGAGVLAVGLVALIDLGHVSLPVTSFDATIAAVLLAAMIVISMLGVHPIVQVAGFTPLLLVVNPDPQLLALTFMFAWGLGTSASPLSGTHLVMQGRYGIPSWKGAMHNLPFVAVMYFVSVGLIYLMQAIRL